MNKDVIYIDVEDDITAIIEKVKSAKEQIVALVPPKRVGVLQSAVNLRLLTRASKLAGKQVVIITNNQALGALAAAATIPVAKNLQSKPELAEIAALDVDDGNDVIDGSQLPVGDLADATDGDSEASPADDLVSEIDKDNKAAGKNGAKPGKNPGSGKGKGKDKKIPDFNKFRKRLIIGIIAVVVLIGGLVWAFVFAPAATVIISANTTPTEINDIVQLGSENNPADGVLRVTTETIERDESVQFSATGREEVGEYATGSVQFSTGSIAALGTTIPSGTILTSSSGKTYATQTSITMTLDTASGVAVAVRATERGASSNAATGAVTGAPSSITARFSGATSGGTDETATIVTADDVQKARQELVRQSTDQTRNELSQRFSRGVVVIEDSFTVDRADASASPAVGQRAEQATLTSKTTYRLSGVADADLATYLDTVLVSQVDGDTTRRVYKNGSDDVRFSEYARSGNQATVRIAAEGQVGPQIDDEQLKEDVAGKKFGDIQRELESREGITSVDIEFSYFWVGSVPNNPDKITIRFDVDDDEN